MTLDLDDCVLTGSALTEQFLREGLQSLLAARPDMGRGWDALRRSLRLGGSQRVHQHVTTPLGVSLGYGRPVRQPAVATREGEENGGWILPAENGQSLRAWSIASDVDLGTSGRSPSTCRASPTRVAQRVLLARGERAGLLTNGREVRFLLCDPSRADSHLTIGIESWQQAPKVTDSFRVLQALASAEKLMQLPAVLDAARLHQVRVTTELRRQAREAIAGFINALPDRTGLHPVALWREGLVLVYRLLFILKLESPAETGAGFSFAATRLWREAVSPNRALGPLVRRHLDLGHDTGRMLEGGLRMLFAVFRNGLHCSELTIAPLGGGLFGPGTTPLLEQLAWGDRAVAILLDRLIWVTTPRGERTRVHFETLDVEDLGSIYEGLLDQEPGIAEESMQGFSRGRPAIGQAPDVRPGDFYLRNSNGRKASGSFYTPHEFVGFLVRETLDPKIALLSPPTDPDPARLLTLKIVDPAAGSGHFLVEVCRYLGEAMLTACRVCDERGLHDRIAALPDAGQSIAAYLPSRGFQEQHARAICRRLVAVHCLYGCDRNKLAIELTKLSLWLESHAEGLPLTFLDHRLAHGDALTGPFFASLATLPVSDGPLDPLLARDVAGRLNGILNDARRIVTRLNASIGRDLHDLDMKRRAKVELDHLLAPLRNLARAWSGAAMLRQRDCDDLWLGLANHVADTGDWPARLTKAQSALMANDSVSWDLAFPEVFPDGFSVVLGNPPWDVVLPNTKDFVAIYDPAILAARTRAERVVIQTEVLGRPGVNAAFDAYREGFERTKRVAGRLYQHQKAGTGASATAGNLDLFRLFAERATDITAADGAIGVLMPSAFHANEGTTAIRNLYLNGTTLQWLLSFENRRRVFDIDSRFKFDLIVAARPGSTYEFRCGFYLTRIDDARDPTKIMSYTTDFLNQTGGTPLELRGGADLDIAKTMYACAGRLGRWCEVRHIRFGNDLHMTADASHFRPAGSADLILHEGKTFHQYTDRWDTKPRYSVPAESVRSEAPRYRRLVFRDIARSNDERTMIACMAPPGSAFGHTATVEKTPWARRPDDALTLCALFNSFPFDWLVRQKTATHLSLYLINGLPVPDLDAPELARAAGALSTGRLEAGAAWDLRAEIDTGIARRYGLTRDQYQHILTSFSHRSYPQAPVLCLAAFDRGGTVFPHSINPDGWAQAQ